ncbi:MAG: peptide chain release factor N(5)-glutamine methyltransferase [Acidobacteriaceae bacterium]|jgi:release factor glutamine methyltransferase
MNAREALAHARQQLEASPELRADAARDATALLLHTLGISRAALLANPEHALTAAQQSTYEAFILRRLTHEPIQYVTGEQEFYGLALRVTPAVLIPRPETELLVEAVLAAVDPTQLLRILDLGTGSGAIAIALAAHLPHAHITATDISPAVLAVARANAARHNLTARIRFVESDLLSALAPGSQDPAALDPAELFDAIVSNPPYVPTADRETLHPQVRDHEPAAALFAGTDGLDIYRRLIPRARAALAPNGLLALEIGHNQRDAIAAMLADWHAVRFLDDLQLIPRVAIARKP